MDKKLLTDLKKVLADIADFAEKLRHKSLYKSLSLKSNKIYPEVKKSAYFCDICE